MILQLVRSQRCRSLALALTRNHRNSNFIITGSIDGHVKFWKKKTEGVEFAKHFRAHLDAITSMSVNYNGTLLATSSRDKTIKVFDVTNFDMINIIPLEYVPSSCAWIHVKESPKQTLAWYLSFVIDRDRS